VFPPSLSSTSTSTSASWDGSDDTTCTGIRNIASRPLDYCNSLMAGLSHVTLEPLQRVQNASVRLILDLNLWDHVTPGQRPLHWLPVGLTLVYPVSCVLSCSPFMLEEVYTTECAPTVSEYTSRSELRSDNSYLYVTPRPRTRFRERAFY